jgi:hypothetical protein
MHLPSSGSGGGNRQILQQSHNHNIINNNNNNTSTANNNNNNSIDWNSNAGSGAGNYSLTEYKGGGNHMIEPLNTSNSSSSPPGAGGDSGSTTSAALTDEFWWTERMVHEAQREYPGELGEFLFFFHLLACQLLMTSLENLIKSKFFLSM